MASQFIAGKFLKDVKKRPFKAISVAVDGG